MATIKSKNEWNFTDEDLASLRDLISALEPLELAIKKLGCKGKVFHILKLIDCSVVISQILYLNSLNCCLLGMNLIGAECV